MIVASFLVKDLLIDWRWGERWFMQNLLDSDSAANNGGWQWIAGTGTDAAPFILIFPSLKDTNIVAGKCTTIDLLGSLEAGKSCKGVSFAKITR